MVPETQPKRSVDADSEVPDLDGLTSYEDDDHLVICDRENPRAWIRSEDVRALEN